MKNLKDTQVVGKERRSCHRFEGMIERKWKKDYEMEMEMEMKRSNRKLWDKKQNMTLEGKEGDI